ncbi:MAG: peptidoglycan-associated lipoprotein Pal [Geminicoccaceae bacterium]
MRKTLALAASLMLLAACSSSQDETLSGTGGAAPGSDITTSGDQSSGLGTGGENGGVASSELNGAATPGSVKDFEVNVGDRVFFGYDSTVLDDRARETLQRQATWLQQFPGVTVTIEGHTDSRGTREYNLALGERRAVAARNYLEALGVPANRILTISYGEERPTDPSETEEAFALNRSAVTVVTATN